MITTADRSFAAELGLFLTGRDTEWTVRSLRTWRRVGRFVFIETSGLYVTKFAVNTSKIEETVADALLWLTPIARHVRTGQHDGIEVVVPWFRSIYEHPRAITECGARAGAADYAPTAALSAIANGEAAPMCTRCREKLEARGGMPAALSDRGGSSTFGQRALIRRLLDEAARCGCPSFPDLVDGSVERLSSREASAVIDRLKIRQQRGWK